jgi:hypothetical protein
MGGQTEKKNYIGGLRWGEVFRPDVKIGILGTLLIVASSPFLVLYPTLKM